MQKGVSPDELETARVTPIYKNNDETDLGNYRATSVLPCFQKSLERIVYNRLQLFIRSPPEVFLGKGVLKIYKFTGEHPGRSVISIKLQSKKPYKKQFGFRKKNLLNMQYYN